MCVYPLAALIAVGFVGLSSVRAQTASPMAESTTDRMIANELDLFAAGVEKSLRTCLELLSRQTNNDPGLVHYRLGVIYAQLGSNLCPNRADILVEVQRLRLSIQTFARSKFGDRSVKYSFNLDGPPLFGNPPTHYLVWQILLEELSNLGANSPLAAALLRLANGVLVHGNPLGFWSYSGLEVIKLLSLGYAINRQQKFEPPRPLRGLFGSFRFAPNRDLSSIDSAIVDAYVAAINLKSGPQLEQIVQSDEEIRKEVKLRAIRMIRWLEEGPVRLLSTGTFRPDVHFLPIPPFVESQLGFKRIDMMMAYDFLRNFTGNGIALNSETTRSRLDSLIAKEGADQ